MGTQNNLSMIYQHYDQSIALEMDSEGLVSESYNAYMEATMYDALYIVETIQELIDEANDDSTVLENWLEDQVFPPNHRYKNKKCHKKATEINIEDLGDDTRGFSFVN